MTKKMIAAGALMIMLVFTTGMNRAWAQESASSTKTNEHEVSRPEEAYRLDFSINELEDGKKINTRQYCMNLSGDDSNELKIGTRVPVEDKQGVVQYIDVGTNIVGRLHTRNGQLELIVHTDMSNFAIPEQVQGHDSHPVIRQMKISGSTVVLPGKPMVIGSVDDPNSKRQFQVEVTVTKLR